MSEPVNSKMEKIALECEEAGASSFEILKVLKELKGQEQDLLALRKKAIGVLKELNPKAAETYASFNRMQVRTSKQFIEPFDRGNIVTSLLRETSIPRSLAEKIGSEVEEQLKDLKINYLNTALIRQLVISKLLEYGKEQIHWQYARVGLPLYDVRKRIEKGPFHNKEILKEFNLFSALPKELTEKHFNCDLHFCAVEDFSHKFYSTAFTPETASKEKFFSRLLKQYLSLKRFFSLEPSFQNFNLALAESLQGEKQKAIESSAKSACNLVEALCFDAASRPSVNLSLFAPEGFPAQLKEPLVLIANAFLEEFQAKERNYALTFLTENEFQVKLLKPKLLKSSMAFLNCSKKQLTGLNENLYSEKGILTAAGLNLNKLAAHYAGKEELFFSELEEFLQAFASLVELKKDLLSKRAYLFEQGLEINDFIPLLGLHALFNASREFLQKECFEKEVSAFALKTIKSIRGSLKEKGLESTLITPFHDSAGIKRFNEFNKKEFNFSGSEDKVKQLRREEELKEHYSFSSKARSRDEAIDFLRENARVCLEK